MKALTWQGKHDVQVIDVPDPRIQEPTDAIIRITSTAICGSDLHLYDPMGPFVEKGDVLGHEPMGIVEEVGSDVTHIKAGDRVVIPFNISCGRCWMCERGFYAQCETTQNREHGKGASLFGYTKLYGQVPGGQAEYLRVPMAHFGPVPVPHDGPDDQFLYLSDILPTAWQAVAFADIPKGGTAAVIGLGPVGQFAARIARHLGAERVIGVDCIRERLAMARRHGVEVVNHDEVDSVGDAVRDLAAGRGADGVIEAVGMEAHGSPFAAAAQKMVGLLPDALAQPFMERAGLDRMAALHTSFDSVRRAGTVSISGVYGGQTDPFPMMDLFDKGVTLRMGQCHVKRWVDDILPLVLDAADPLGVADLATHHLPLADGPHGYELFQKKQDECIKVVLRPGT